MNLSPILPQKGITKDGAVKQQDSCCLTKKKGPLGPSVGLQAYGIYGAGIRSFLAAGLISLAAARIGDMCQAVVPQVKNIRADTGTKAAADAKIWVNFWIHYLPPCLFFPYYITFGEYGPVRDLHKTKYALRGEFIAGMVGSIDGNFGGSGFRGSECT